MTRIGNYEILEKIGEGGFGRTYKAKHVHLNVLHALIEDGMYQL